MFTPKSNFKIEQLGSTFKITDPKGVIYYFGGTSTSREEISNAQTMVLNSDGAFYSDPPFYIGGHQTWMLTRIEFPGSDKIIEFEYTIESNVSTSVFQQEEYMKPGITTILPIPDACLPQIYDQVFIKKEFTQPKIREIKFPNGIVRFSKGNVMRSDLYNSYPLETIELLDKNYSRIKAFKLHTSYTESPIDERHFFDFRNEGKYRLRLDSISSFDKNLSVSLPYVFEYNSTALPDRHSKSQDYFGYYNGKSNSGLIPKSVYEFGASSFSLSGYGTGDRSIDPAYTQAGILKKVTFPTGGSEVYTWENNIIQSLINPDNEYVDYLIKDTHVIQNTCLFNDPDPNIDFSKEFTLHSDSTGKVDFEIAMAGCPGPELNTNDCAYILKVEGVSTSYTSTLFNSSTVRQLLPGHTYKVTAKSRNPILCDPCVDPSCSTGSTPEFLNVVFNTYTDPTPGEYMYGGLRISKIDTYDAPTQLAFTRNYDYTEFGGNLSSGRVPRFIDNYINDWRMMCYVDNDPLPGGTLFANLTFKLLANNPQSILLTKGSFVGYTNITETYNGNTQNGRKEYTYSFNTVAANNPYSNQFSSGFPDNFENPIAMDWRNGNLMMERYFDNSGKSLKDVSYNYETANTDYVEYFGVQLLRMQSIHTTFSSEITGTDFQNIYVSSYNNATEHHRLKSQTNIDYFDNNQVVTTTNYHYGNNPLLASKASMVNSANLTNETHTLYAHDMPVPTLAEQELIGQNRYEIVKTEAILKDGSTTLSYATTENVYHDWGNGQVLPKTVKTGKDTNPANVTLIDRIAFEDYDADGNILQVAKTDGMDISYIYGYDKTLPVAKIENATYAQVTSYVANIQAKSDLDDDRCQDSGSCDEKNLRTALNALRSALPNAMVTTYTYDPLVGITSITDPKGYTMYYEYDNFNRLQRVKDQDGNIITENEYYYYSQN